jgi:transcriptional regulator with XRE-family HTH domain
VLDLQIVARRPDYARTRIKKGFSQRELARQTGLSSSFLIQFENGKRNIGPEAASKICQVLGVEFEEIFEVVVRE